MNTYFYTPSKWNINTLEITGVRTESETLMIPSRINGYPVSSIAKSAFRNKQHIRHVILENGIEIIDADAFLDCRFLETVVLPKTLSLIASHAFQRCFRLKELTLPSSLRRIGTGAFEDCKSLKTITITNTLSGKELPLSIGDCAFHNCHRLDQFSFFNTPHFIGAGCFSHTELPVVSEDGFIHVAKKILLGYEGKSPVVKIPDGIITIAAEAFCGKHFMTQVFFPPSIKIIGKKAFYKCSSLRMVTGHENVTEIHAHAFEDCTSLSVLPVCSALTYLGDYSFAGCIGIRQIHLPPNLFTVHAGSFKDCVHAEHIYFPSTLREIRTSAFENCSGIYHLHLPDSITFIGKSAFFGCSNLKSFTLPDSLQTLEDDAFGKCTSLMSVTARRWNFHQGFLGNEIHIDLIFRNETDGRTATLFYSDDWQRFSQGGRARLMLSLFDAPEKIDFIEYDTCLPLLKYPEDQAHFALDRLLYPTGLSEEKRLEYETFVKNHPKDTLEVILKRDMENAALLLCDHDLLSEESLELAVDLANHRHKTSILLIFMNHKHKITDCNPVSSAENILDRLFHI